MTHGLSFVERSEVRFSQTQLPLSTLDGSLGGRHRPGCAKPGFRPRRGVERQTNQSPVVQRWIWCQCIVLLDLCGSFLLHWATPLWCPGPQLERRRLNRPRLLSKDDNPAYLGIFFIETASKFHFGSERWSCEWRQWRGAAVRT